MNQGRREDSTWRVVGWSEDFDADDPHWVSTATHHIKQAEVFVLLLGPTSFRSPGVLKEITIAKILNKQIYQIVPPGKGTPNVIPNIGKVVYWEWAAVKRAIATMPPKWQTGKIAYA